MCSHSGAAGVRPLRVFLSEKGYDISLWVYEESLAEEIRNTRINSIYLPDIAIPDNIRITHKLDEAVRQARYVVSAIPTQYTRAVFKKADFYIPDEAVIISASKGIERGTLLTVSSIFKEITGHKIAVLSGPSFAKEAIMKKPTAVTLATEDTDTGLLLQEILNTNHFRVYTNNDLIGVELGGALKNVMAIASGISDGLGLGNNKRAAMITRGLAEMRRLGLAMGAKEETFSGLSGLGDLVLTCTSVISRNHTTGVKLAQGIKLADILSQTRAVAEGVDTAESAYQLSKNIMLRCLLWSRYTKSSTRTKSPAEAVNDLMNRVEV